MNVVISQPMFFPWVGLYEQIRLADIYVHYSDVQFSKGGFVNRVQIKTPQGIKWMTVPLEGRFLGQNINEVLINYRTDWRQDHLQSLGQVYSESPFSDQMLDIVDSVYSVRYETIDQLSKSSISAICSYYRLDEGRMFLDSEDLHIGGSGSRRVLDIVKHLGGNRYLTGLGARNYLDHELFDDAGVRVEYMSYLKRAYPQLHGEFTPYVSILDLIANTGEEGIDYICSGTLYWKEYLENDRN